MIVNNDVSNTKSLRHENNKRKEINLKVNNTASDFSSKINQKYSRCLKYKSQYLSERHKLSYFLEERGISKLLIDKRELEKLPLCTSLVPINKGKNARLGEHRRCSREIMFPGFNKCFTHNTMFISKALETGAYKEIIKNGKLICDPNHFVQVIWTDTKGYSLYIPYGQKGDLVSWMDGPYKLRRDCTPNYIFQPSFRLPADCLKLKDLCIDGLQVPIHGRGVMSFANVSPTPNCARNDEFDQLNSRVWYQLTEDLLPKADGSLHEITISYNNKFNYKNMAIPIPIAERKVFNPNEGIWPGKILTPRVQITVGDNKSNLKRKSLHQEAVHEPTTKCIDKKLDIETGNNSVSIEERQRQCVLFYHMKTKAFLSILKKYKDEVLDKCYECGLQDLHDHLSCTLKSIKKIFSNAPVDDNQLSKVRKVELVEEVTL